MTNAARSIQDFISPNKSEPQDARIEAPSFTGHLLDLPCTDGSEASIDPEEIISVSKHRTDEEVTVVRQRNDTYVYFVARPYSTVKAWIAEALRSD